MRQEGGALGGQQGAKAERAAERLFVAEQCLDMLRPQMVDHDDQGG